MSSARRAAERPLRPPVKFHDYYAVLGVPRDASAQQIQKAWRKLARELHPDVNKAPDAAERFKAAAEAYEVLKDPEKRKRYDQLGARWKEGESFTPPPGYEHAFRGGFGGGGFEGDGDAGYGSFDFGGFGDGAGGFSDFFESLFGGAARRAGGRRAPRARAGRTLEASMQVSLADLVHGGTRSLELELPTLDAAGETVTRRRALDVRLPPGATDGTRIRLAGQGLPGHDGGPPGDLLLRLELVPDARFHLHGHDLATRLEVRPHEAALGGKVDLRTPSGTASVRVPPGSSSGRKLRLRGLGLPKRDGTRGDLVAELAIVLPGELSPRERELYEELARIGGASPGSRSGS